MSTRPLHRCECVACQQEADHPERILHEQMNLFASRLDEQQRRWYAAVEAQRIGHGGILLIAQITGLDEDTISRGRRELANTLGNTKELSNRSAGMNGICCGPLR